MALAVQMIKKDREKTTVNGHYIGNYNSQDVLENVINFVTVFSVKVQPEDKK